MTYFIKSTEANGHVNGASRE